MVSDQLESKLAQKVEGTSRDLDWAVEEYEDALEHVEERVMEDVPEEKRREYALGMVETEQIFQDRVGGGEEMELEILSIGQAGKIDEWGEENQTVVYGYGFIYGPLGDEGKEKAGRAVFINSKERGVSPRDAMEKFRPENTMKAVYEVSESQDLDGVYRCFSSGRTNLEEGTLDSLPDDRSEKLEILRSAIPEASLATLSEDLSSYDPETGFTYDFGADLRRIEGKIVDYYIDDDGEWGRYTIMDDSVTGDDIVGTDIVGDDQNVPGLTCWAEPDYHMEYGRNSRCEFYGTVEEGSNGNLVMNVVGIIPIVPADMDDEGSTADEDVNATESQI